MARPLVICGIVLACLFISVEAQGNILSNQCYHCGAGARQGAVTNPRMCRQIKSCAEHEVCWVTAINTAGFFSYEFGCHEKLQCQLLTIANLESEFNVTTGVDVSHLLMTGEVVGRKRQIKTCNVCCGDGLCNDADCETVRRTSINWMGKHMYRGIYEDILIIARIAQFALAGKFNYTTLRLIR